MPDLLLKETELKQLDLILQEVPTKFGIPILNVINGAAQARQQEALKESNKLPVQSNSPVKTEDPVEEEKQG